MLSNKVLGKLDETKNGIEERRDCHKASLKEGDLDSAKCLLHQVS